MYIMNLVENISSMGIKQERMQMYQIWWVCCSGKIINDRSVWCSQMCRGDTDTNWRMNWYQLEDEQSGFLFLLHYSTLFRIHQTFYPFQHFWANENEQKGQGMPNSVCVCVYLLLTCLFLQNIHIKLPLKVCEKSGHILHITSVQIHQK